MYAIACLCLTLVQEEIKIISTSVFVNPYSEPDEEEEEKKTEEEKTIEDAENVSVLAVTLMAKCFFFIYFITFSNLMHVFFWELI